MTLPPAYAQVLGLGLLWTSVHCVGMCGPLLSGFDIAGVMRGRTRWQGVFGVLSYQAGRGLTYAWLGSLAGLLGAGLSHAAQTGGAVLAIVAGVVLCGLALRALRPLPVAAKQDERLVPLRTPRTVSLSPSAVVQYVLGHAKRSLLPLLASRHPLREVALGALMGLLPCMIPAWALSQAALTGSPLHGALVMLLLVALTTPILLFATQLPRLVQALPDKLRSALPYLLYFLSGCWLILVGGAGLNLWQHAHVGFSILGRPLMMMLF